jgi:branched-chain amino acid transport system ATP-binding protein
MTTGVEFLRVTDLHAFYGESHILHGVDFNVNRGEVVTLLGRNGAGRTTTLKSILGWSAIAPGRS